LHTIIRYPNDQRVEALVLSIGRFAMRVVPHGMADTIELSLNSGQWTDESGVPIELESFFQEGDMSSTFEMPAVRAAVS